MNINYAQCWEDGAFLRHALRLAPCDSVLSIASGGDNSLELLLDGPRCVTALDSNPAQIHLLALKVAAMRVLPYEEFTEFMGATPSRRRAELYRAAAPLLTADARAFWHRQPGAIRHGVIHCGRFERYASVLRFALRGVVSRRTLSRFLSLSSPEEQSRLYRSAWDGRRWRLLFATLVNRYTLGRWARCEGAFSQVDPCDVSAALRARIEHALTSEPARDNYFLWYLLAGRYPLPETAPAYLLPSGFQTIRSELHRLRWVTADLEDYLRSVPAVTYSAFNLSDVPEYMSRPRLAELSACLAHAASPHARLAHWTMFTAPDLPDWPAQEQPSSDGYRADRGLFYGSFQLRARTASVRARPRLLDKECVQ
jgi:S-adenosylmethionine-diacylglycerol 3-amino-3-carboxypropyl transferase